MSLALNNLTRSFSAFSLALSVRRLWEHTELGQINPFIPTTETGAQRPEAFIDVVVLKQSAASYMGVTVEVLRKTPFDNASYDTARKLLISRYLNTVDSKQWLQEISSHILEYSERQAVRNTPGSFLSASNHSPVGLAGLKCVLPEWLQRHGSQKYSPSHWRNGITNLAKQGLKAEEIEKSALLESLDRVDARKSVTGRELSALVDFQALKINILPVLETAESHLTWQPVLNNTPIKRKKNILGNPSTSPQWRDPVMGYWIDSIEWNDLLNDRTCWLVLNHEGTALTTKECPAGLFDSPDQAKEVANKHAQRVLPRLTAKGKWSDFRLTGGKNYREWLVTLPWYGASFFSNHFYPRNILLHMRTDLREGADGETVLFVQELQSDWAQLYRRQKKGEDVSDEQIPKPPWFNEWTSLAIKLLLLHAVDKGIGAVAWTTGEHQAQRYDGLGEVGLRELYDRTLPRDASKIVGRVGGQVERIDLFIPDDFSIEPTESGYSIWDSDEDLVGTTTDWANAQQLIPSGGHELLHSMHGIRLTPKLRSKILEDEFYAWGMGVAIK